MEFLCLWSVEIDTQGTLELRCGFSGECVDEAAANVAIRSIVRGDTVHTVTVFPIRQTEPPALDTPTVFRMTSD